jgi:hypothetical protein
MARQGAKAVVAVSLQGTHTEFVGQREGVPRRHQGRLDLRRLPVEGDVAHEPQNPRLMAALLGQADEIQGSLRQHSRLLRSVVFDRWLPRLYDGLCGALGLLGTTRAHAGARLGPKPRWSPWPALLYAQVVKSYRRWRIVGVKHRVVFGTREAVMHVLSACGRQINTAFVERLNLDIRQRVAAVGRRVNTLCQGEDGLCQQLVLYRVYYNFVLPHASLRQPLRVLEATNGRGSAKVWRPCTPAMAAGLTAHVWSLKEVCLYRVPPWPQPQTL